MDLPFLETAATISKHAVVLLASGGAVAGYRAWYFAVKNDLAKRLHAQFAVFVLAALGAFAGYSVYYFTDEISLQRERVAKEKEAELEHFKLEKGAEIASASMQAAEAIARAAKLENDNLTLRGTVATLETTAAEAGRKLTLLQAKTAEAILRQTEAEAKLAQVTERQKPRSERVHRQNLVSILKTAPRGKVMILHQQQNRESVLFVLELQTAFQEAGWQILGVKAIPNTNVAVDGVGNQIWILG